MIYITYLFFGIVSIAIILGMIYFFFYNFYMNIYLKYKKKNVYIDFETALAILKIIINTELDAYENDIFISKGSITNSNFDNYYKDITNKIIKSISSDLINYLSFYITEDMVYIIIARSVKNFLTNKINGTT